MQLKTWLQSSQDPTQVAKSVEGVILSLSAVIVLVATQFFHIQLSANDVITLATELGATAGAMMTIFGLIRKVVIFFGTKSVVQ